MTTSNLYNLASGSMNRCSTKKSKKDIFVATRPAPGSTITYANILTPDPKDSSRLAVKDDALGPFVSSNADNKGMKTH
jgi:hypothetical protein